MGPGDPVGSLIAGIMGRSTRPSWRGAITLVTITGNRLSDHRTLKMKYPETCTHTLSIIKKLLTFTPG